MKNIIKLFFIFVGLIVVALAIIPAFLPKSLTIQVEKEIKAPNKVLFEEVNVLKKFTSWNAWFKKDSATSFIYFSPYAGKDATFQWLSEKEEIGKGETQIVLSKPHSVVKTKIFVHGFDRPMMCNYYILKSDENKSVVMILFDSGESTYFGRIINYFKRAELEKTFAQSLENLALKMQTMNFSPAPTRIKPEEIRKEFFKGQKLITLSLESDIETKALSKNIYDAAQKIKKLFYRNKFTETDFGKMTIFYDTWDETTKKTKLQVGFPIYKTIEQIPEEMNYYYIPEGNVLKTYYEGKLYDTKSLYEKINDYGLTNDIELGKAWEEYQSDLSKKDSAKVYIYHEIKN